MPKIILETVYLALYRGECDDLPIKAFVGRAEAEAYAETLRGHYRGWKHWEPHHPDVEAYLDSEYLDVGTYIDVSVISVPFITGV